MPRAFRHALEPEGERGGFSIFGSHPLYNVEAEYVSVFPNTAEFNVDLSYFSDTNSLGAWFVLEKRTDMWGFFSTKPDYFEPAKFSNSRVSFYMLKIGNEVKGSIKRESRNSPK